MVPLPEAAGPSMAMIILKAARFARLSALNGALRAGRGACRGSRDRSGQMGRRLAPETRLTRRLTRSDAIVGEGVQIARYMHFLAKSQNTGYNYSPRRIKAAPSARSGETGRVTL